VLVVAGTAALVIWLPRREGRPREPASATNNATFVQVTDQPGPEYFPSLSPDGKSVVYASRAGGNWDIYLQRVGGRNPVNLTMDSQADDTQPVFSPDGERIAFRSEREQGGIYVMGATGESVIRVSDTGYNPSWSSDGGQIVFATERVTQPSVRPSLSRIWVVDLKTGAKRPIGDGDALQPAWSPHGTRIAYWSRPSSIEHGDDIWTIAAAGGKPVPVTHDRFVDWNPVWSPDGAHLYFCSNRGGSMNIWRVAIDEKSGAVSGEPEAVTIGAGAAAQHLTFSRDGRRMAYAAQEEVRNLRRVAFDPSAGRVTGAAASITRGSMQLWFPDPSPDGEWLVSYSMGNQRHIFLLRPDGSGLRDLTNDNFRHSWPRWSPDGKHIAFSSRRSGDLELWMIQPDGSGLRQITRSPGAHYAPWSPDGRFIVYSIHTPRNDCVIFEPGKPWGEQKLRSLAPLEDTSAFETWSWSPDGKRLAGIRHRPDGGHAGVGTYDFESRRYDWITDFGDWPLWLNDSRRILFVNGGRIMILDTRSRKYESVLDVFDGDLDPGSPGLSRDNRTLYFTFVAAEADIWVMSQ